MCYDPTAIFMRKRRIISIMEWRMLEKLEMEYLELGCGAFFSYQCQDRPTRRAIDYRLVNGHNTIGWSTQTRDIYRIV